MCNDVADMALFLTMKNNLNILRNVEFASTILKILKLFWLYRKYDMIKLSCHVQICYTLDKPPL